MENGLTEAKISALDEPEDTGQFTSRERVALKYAELLGLCFEERLGRCNILPQPNVSHLHDGRSSHSLCADLIIHAFGSHIGYQYLLSVVWSTKILRQDRTTVANIFGSCTVVAMTCVDFTIDHVKISKK